MRYFLRFLLLMIGVALTTLGIIFWHDRGYSIVGLWFFDAGFRLHPLHILILGIALIPPTMWEQFQLDQSTPATGKRSQARSAERPDSSNQPGAGSSAQ